MPFYDLKMDIHKNERILVSDDIYLFIPMVVFYD